MSWYIKSFILYIQQYMTHLLLKLWHIRKKTKTKVEKVVGFTNNYMLNTPHSNYAYTYSYSHYIIPI